MQDEKLISRRSFALGAVSLSFLSAACTTTRKTNYAAEPLEKEVKSDLALSYGPLDNEEFPIPAVDLSKIDDKFLRQTVKYDTQEPVGTVIVDTKNFYLYLIEPNGYALRYGVGLGRAGFEWSGKARIAWKRKWPVWTPPAEMIERQPELAKYGVDFGGMPPGLDNALGSRALYIFQGNEDTLYRLHGTQEVHSIGKAVSSGCVRLLNHDVIDLYERVKPGAKIIVA